MFVAQGQFPVVLLFSFFVVVVVVVVYYLFVSLGRKGPVSGRTVNKSKNKDWLTSPPLRNTQCSQHCVCVCVCVCVCPKTSNDE